MISSLNKIWQNLMAIYLLSNRVFVSPCTSMTSGHQDSVFPSPSYGFDFVVSVVSLSISNPLSSSILELVYYYLSMNLTQIFVAFGSVYEVWILKQIVGGYLLIFFMPLTAVLCSRWFDMGLQAKVPMFEYGHGTIIKFSHLSWQHDKFRADASVIVLLFFLGISELSILETLAKKQMIVCWMTTSLDSSRYELALCFYQNAVRLIESKFS